MGREIAILPSLSRQRLDGRRENPPLDRPLPMTAVPASTSRTEATMEPRSDKLNKRACVFWTNLR
jgi:hypothetical protein